MKRTYQIEERKAIQRFRSHLINDPGNIQLVLPLADIAERLRNGVDHMLFEAELQLLQVIMEDEVSWLSGARYQRRNSHGTERWGTAHGSVIVHGQKVPLQRPRIRSSSGDMKLGSYELFRREEDMQRRVWSRIMRGLTMRGYDPAMRERDRAFGLSKSSISDRFVLASTEQVNTLLKRDLSKLNLCALMVDGVEYHSEHFVVALGIDQTGAKTILGFHQGATENQPICDQLLNELVSRGLNLKQSFMAVIDGGRAVRASIRKHSEHALVQRCQLHKRRNITEHFADDQQKYWDRKLANAYDLFSYQDAKRALNQIQRELMDVNPSAARSLDEGLDETLTVHRLGVPAELRRVLRTTNPIESAFSRVRTVCQNVKRWRDGDQRERWIGSALIFAEQKFRRIVGCQAMPKFLGILQAYTGDSKKTGKIA